MSIVDRIWSKADDSSLKPLDKFTLLAIGRNSDDKGQLKETLSGISKQTGMTIANLCRKLSRLADAGYIIKKGQKKGFTYKLNLRRFKPSKGKR